MTLIPAVIALCLSAPGAPCEKHEVRIEPRACHIGALRAEVPIGGAWQPATATITCQGR